MQQNKGRTHGLWVRYGGQDPTPEQIAFAAEHYSVALLQPAQTEAAVQLKKLNPAMVVLCYKCLSSTRVYEDGPVFTSGLSFAEAESLETTGKSLFAYRRSGERIEWSGYPGHFQMAVWKPDYRKRWIANVCAELEESPFDGVMADNDCFGDYYGLDLPIQGARQMRTIHKGLDKLVREAGKALNKIDKILVPNIAESRVDPGKWERHSAYGGGFEEVFLGWGADEYLDYFSARAQLHEMQGKFPPVKLASGKQPRLAVMRAASDNDVHHPNFLAALAAFWVFGGGEWTALSCGGHDEHNDTPWIPQLAWDLGSAQGKIREENGASIRRFSRGWAAINLTDSETGKLRVPANMVDAEGKTVHTVKLAPHQGIVLSQRSAG